MKFFTTVWLFLLCYVIAALLFWGVSLQRQSGEIYQKDRELLTAGSDSLNNPADHAAAIERLDKKRKARTSQYLGEGITFLFVILLGAAIVFTSFRRKIKLSRQQNNFMLSVTHELKSPLAAVKLNLQTLEKRKLEESQQKKLLHSSITEADRLNDLCNKILVASQMDGRHYRSTPERIDLSQIAASSSQQYNDRYPGRIATQIDPGIIVNGDRVLLQLAINNLLENAVKYAPGGEAITVTVNRVGANAALCVLDRGPGIPDAQKKEVFKKFFRLGDEATRSTKGTGLGLYLTAKIARQHKGKITVKNNEPNGSIFQLTLPAPESERLPA